MDKASVLTESVDNARWAAWQNQFIFLVKVTNDLHVTDYQLQSPNGHCTSGVPTRYRLALGVIAGFMAEVVRTSGEIILMCGDSDNGEAHYFQAQSKVLA